MVHPDGLFFRERKRIAELALERKIPTPAQAFAKFEQLKDRNLGSEFYARVFSELYTSKDPTLAALAELERREKRPAGTARAANG